MVKDLLTYVVFLQKPLLLLLLSLWITRAFPDQVAGEIDTSGLHYRIARVSELMEGDTAGFSDAADRLMAEIDRLADSRPKAEVLFRVAYSFLGRTENRALATAARQGIRLSERLEDIEMTGRFHALLGSEANGRRDAVLAEAHLDSAIEVLGDAFPSVSAAARRDLGRFHYEQGDYSKALNLYFEAQNDYEKAGLRGSEYAHLLHYIGSVFKRTHSDERAVVYYEEMLALARQLADTTLICEALDLCSDVHAHLGDIPKADSYIEEALSLVGRTGDDRLHVQILLNAAHHWKYNGDYSRAISYVFQAQSIMLRTGRTSNELFMTRLLGDLYSRKGEHDKAFEYLEKALQMAENSTYKRTLFLSETYWTLAFASQRKGDHVAAFDYLLDHMDYKDSLVNEQNVKAITDLEHRYERERLDNEIKLLTLDNALNEKTISRQNVVRNAMGLGLVAALLLMGGAYVSLTRNKRKNAIIRRQAEEVAKQNEAILASIEYAKKLQEAVLPPAKVVKDYFADSFLLYLPRDIVSGDFYWMESISPSSGGGGGEVSYFAVGDCTGHGVPGAMLSVMGLNGLNRALNELRITRPADMLTQLTKDLHDAFLRSDATVRDGMDLAICALDVANRKLTFAGANNPLWIARNGEMLIFKPNKRPVGFHDMHGEGFSQAEIDLLPGDTIYLMTDGYQDQLGGPKGLKMMTKVFRSRLLELSSLPLMKQREQLISELNAWRGEVHQTDDVCMIGVRV